MQLKNLNLMAVDTALKEFAKDMTAYFGEIRKRETIRNKQLEKFHAKAKNIGWFCDIVDRIIMKYQSDEYRDKWYNLRKEPPEELYWFLFQYAMRYGRECNEDEWRKYGTEFTSGMFYIHGYYISRLDGQGSCIIIDKSK